MKTAIALLMPLTGVVLILAGAWLGGVIGIISVPVGVLLWEFRPGLDPNE